MLLKCLECRDYYILRVNRIASDQFETEFKRCICGNDHVFHIEVIGESKITMLYK